MSVTRSILDYLQAQGMHTVDTDYRAHIDRWRSWYRGKVEHFHTYTVFNGVRRVKCSRKTLGMAKMLAEDWASLLLNERVRIAVDHDQDALDALLRANRWRIIGNRCVEYAFALGTAGWSEYLGPDGAPCVDVHQAEEIWPLSWHGTRVTECAFSSLEVVGGEKCVFLRIYRRGAGGQTVIENALLDQESGEARPLPEGVPARVETGIAAPLFQIVTPNLANNIDTTCPMGLAVFANALDILESVDGTYDSLANEYLLGRKRLMVPLSMVQRDQTASGRPDAFFDPNDLAFAAYPAAGDGSDEFHDFSPEIRAEAHVRGLRTELNALSIRCGLGAGRYEFERAAGVKTATEVISEDSDLYQNLQKHEIILESAIAELCNALLLLSGRQPAEVSITFDDSIIQDKSAERSEAREDVAAGLMSKYTYLTQIRGLSEKDADEELERIRSESRVGAEALDFFGLKNSD